VLVLIGVAFFWINWSSALIAAAIIFGGGRFLKAVLSRTLNRHYEFLISQSMISRYANYVRDGDTLRAEAMKHLLRKSGIDTDATRGRVKEP